MNQAQSSHEQPTGLCRGETFLFYRAASILNLRKLPLQKHSQLDIITAEIFCFFHDNNIWFLVKSLLNCNKIHLCAYKHNCRHSLWFVILCLKELFVPSCGCVKGLFLTLKSLKE